MLRSMSTGIQVLAQKLVDRAAEELVFDLLVSLA